MCCHRLYVYTTCGHSTLSSKPLIEPDGHQSTSCEIIAHPYQSWKIETLCPPCQHQRDTLMSRIETTQVVKFDEWRWKVSYGMPAHGKDFWGRRADEREKREQELEREGKRKSTRKSVKAPSSPAMHRDSRLEP
jgi:hypothetical protein